MLSRTLIRAALAAVQAGLSEVPENSHAWTYHIRGFDKSLYLSRTILPRLFGARPLIHRIWRADADVFLHNHPWAWARFLCVSGGYTEERLVRGEIVRRAVMPGDVNAIDRDTFHSAVCVLPNTWTVGVVGPRVQDWGFLVDDVVVPHKEYFARVGHDVQVSGVS